MTLKMNGMTKSMITMIIDSNNGVKQHMINKMFKTMILVICLGLSLSGISTITVASEEHAAQSASAEAEAAAEAAAEAEAAAAEAAAEAAEAAEAAADAEAAKKAE